MIYFRITALEKAVKALEQGDRSKQKEYEDLQCQVCATSRLLAFDLSGTLHSRPEVVSEVLLNEVDRVFARALQLLGDSRYEKSVISHKADIDEARQTAKERQDEDKKFMQWGAQKSSVASPRAQRFLD